MTNAHTLRKNVTKRSILQLIVENHALSIALIMNTLNLSYATVFRYLKLLSEEDVIECTDKGVSFTLRSKRIQKLNGI